MIASSIASQATFARVLSSGELKPGESKLPQPAESEPPLMTIELARAQIVVRPLQENDVRALEWHGGPDLRSFYETQWAQHQEGSLCVLVADFNRFPIGQAAIHWRGKPTHPAIPDIQSLRVFGAFQGLGIGTGLLAASEDVVAGLGFPQVSLAVALHNEAARRLYERLHYHVSGEPYVDIWEYRDARGQVMRIEETVVDMVKTLEGARAGSYK